MGGGGRRSRSRTRSSSRSRDKRRTSRDRSPFCKVGVSFQEQVKEEENKESLMKEFKEDIAILLWSLRRYCKDIAKPNFKTLITFNTLYDFAPCNVWMNLSRDDFFCGEIKWGYPFSEK